MGRYTPYIQRRGFGLSFRLSVPQDLRGLVGTREITLALPNSDRRSASPMALEFAARAKRMFSELRSSMAEPGESKSEHPEIDVGKLKELVRVTRQNLRIHQMESEHEVELFEQRRKHIQEIKLAKLEAENSALKLAVSQIGMGGAGVMAMPLAAAPAPSLPSTKSESVPTFKVVVDSFLNGFKKDKKPAMFKKLRPVLAMLLEVVGDKPISEIRQRDINEFFSLLGHLPPRWADECRKQKLMIRQLAELEHPRTLGPKTFTDTYLASVRPFLVKAKKDWQDQGFPLGLTTDGIEYDGDRDEGESKQRAMTRQELKRLFEGPEIQGFASDPALAHFFWLPHLGLFTGARVNELCQLNPQTDILLDTESVTWYLWITTETEADSRIKKSVKRGVSRKVPIHKMLVELGFLKYVARIKATGAKLLFPDWEPINKRASGEAEKWFRQLLRDMGLRDQTPKACILGMHAFRHTLLTYGAMQKPPLSLFCITGHAQDEGPISATGAGKGYLDLSLISPVKDKASLLDQLDYGLTFNSPIQPK